MTERPIAMITGGAQGIGLASAEALPADGLRCVLVDINASVTDAAKKLGGGASGYVCDMSDPAAIHALFD